jgi:hypothetical protein
MKFLSARIAVVALALLFTFQLSAQNANNPIQVALLRWYQANTVAQLSACGHPNGVAFDGAHIWAACPLDDTIQEFNASDGAQVRIISGFHEPQYLLYDGANIWVSNYLTASVTEVNASTGAKVRTVNVGGAPVTMTFDGTYVWVANSNDDSISQVQVTTGVVTPHFFTTPPLPRSPRHRLRWGARMGCLPQRQYGRGVRFFGQHPAPDPAHCRGFSLIHCL